MEPNESQHEVLFVCVLYGNSTFGDEQVAVYLDNESTRQGQVFARLKSGGSEWTVIGNYVRFGTNFRYRVSSIFSVKYWPGHRLIFDVFLMFLKRRA